MGNHAVDTHQYHSRTSQRSGLLSGYVGSNFTVHMLDNHLVNVGSASVPGLGLGLGIAANNIRLALFSSIFSLIVFGAFAFLAPAVTFARIGLVASALNERGGSWLVLGGNSLLSFLLAYVLPHSIIDLPVAILSATIGIRVGVALMSPPKGFTVGQNILWSLA